MAKSLKYYEYTDNVGVLLATEIMKDITPLLNEKKFDEAKKKLKDFYKPAKYKTISVFIEYDMILSKINRLIKEIESITK